MADLIDEHSWSVCPACNHLPTLFDVARMSGVIAVFVVQVRCDCGMSAPAVEDQQVGLPLSNRLVDAARARAVDLWNDVVRNCLDRRQQQVTE